MKKWNTPSITELNINETANGYFKVGYEGPFDIVLGDRKQAGCSRSRHKRTFIIQIQLQAPVGLTGVLFLR